jgi:tetrahydromethanopterin S-methyltransferase subunit G
MCTEDELWITSGNEQKIDQDSSSRFADIAARLDKLEKIAALPATSASESANVVARLDKLEKKVAVAAAPASEIAGLTTRLNKLEKKAAAAGASSADPSRLPRRNNRRLWQGRNLPPRMKQPDPTTQGPCSETIASRMYGTASRWLTVALVPKR